MSNLINSSVHYWRLNTLDSQLSPCFTCFITFSTQRFAFRQRTARRRYQLAITVVDNRAGCGTTTDVTLRCTSTCTRAGRYKAKCSAVSGAIPASHSSDLGGGASSEIAEAELAKRLPGNRRHWWGRCLSARLRQRRRLAAERFIPHKSSSIQWTAFR